MFVVLWEFEVKPGCEERFEKVYGPSGDWAALFGTDSRYQQTRLLRNTSYPLRYITFDFWQSRESYKDFLQKHAAEYQVLDSLGKVLINDERHIVSCEWIAP